MKLMIMIVRDSDDDAVVQSLVGQEYRVTRMSSTGGFLRRGNVTLLVGVEDEQVDTVMDLVRGTCCPPQSEESRATIFVVDLPHFAKI